MHQKINRGERIHQAASVIEVSQCMGKNDYCECKLAELAELIQVGAFAVEIRLMHGEPVSTCTALLPIFAEYQKNGQLGAANMPAHFAQNLVDNLKPMRISLLEFHFGLN
eukprot:TRINITY_DN101984_c0_g1_i1.p3 TRINITY_DN101984_c0_g1~~TRINITY_DN101984_c0_g1_i1.p3  ORF type:complete len:110 (+),score=20.81 TRINITY_DN101984_c0_g1_i1:176-505(+)